MQPDRFPRKWMDSKVTVFFLAFYNACIHSSRDRDLDRLVSDNHPPPHRRLATTQISSQIFLREVMQAAVSKMLDEGWKGCWERMWRLKELGWTGRLMVGMWKSEKNYANGKRLWSCFACMYGMYTLWVVHASKPSVWRSKQTIIHSDSR